ncbi:MAG: FMN reductase [Melioribacteraceae bacterium]|nr:MAG: FMN reductase [Melioribacteraceae bacterium]
MKLNIAVIYGSVRTARKGIYVAKYIESNLKEMGHNATIVDPMEYPLPLIDKMYKEYDKDSVPEALVKLHDILDGADGFIIVSGEYNHSIPPALSNLMDYFQSEYLYKPSGIVSYSAGIFGGVRAAVHLRAYLAELGASSIPSTLPIGKIGTAFDESYQPTDPKFERRYKKFIEEFIWYSEALRSKREKTA